MKKLACLIISAAILSSCSIAPEENQDNLGYSSAASEANCCRAEAQKWLFGMKSQCAWGMVTICWDRNVSKEELYFSLEFNEDYFITNPSAEHCYALKFETNVSVKNPDYLKYTDSTGDAVEFNERDLLPIYSDRTITISYADAPEKDKEIFNGYLIISCDREYWSNQH